MEEKGVINLPSGRKPKRERWGKEKLALCRTKATISLKHVKIEENLLWTAYRNSPTLFRMVPSPTPMASPCVGIARDHPNFGVPPINLGTGKSMDFKFGRYIHRMHPN